MIRRDYFLRMIEEFIQALARIHSLKKGQHWQEAAVRMDAEFDRLVGAGAEAVARLSETELLARLIKGESTLVTRDKTLMLSALLKEAGDLAATGGTLEESRLCYLKGLHLVLQTLARGEIFEFPEFVPKVEVFVAALGDSPLPLETHALLMQHYERTGQFAKAEDAIFAMLDVDPANPAILEFGMAFYERLRAQSDASLNGGNLPRPEVEAGLAELSQRNLALSTQ